MPNPEILCIGHVCHDVAGDGYVLGGTAAYCSMVAANLGYPTALLTSFGPDFLFEDTLVNRNISLVCKPATATTVFQNIYEGDHRVQYLKNRASVLCSDDIPAEWSHVPIVKYCLIADELDPTLLSAFPGALKGATIQGWLRQWDDSGLISPKPMDWSLLRSLDVICMSKEDLAGFEDKIPEITSLVDVVVITDGRNETLVHASGGIHHFPAYPVSEVDPTGAGDVFAAVFLLTYAESRNIIRASIYAHCAASLVVEGLGLEKLNDLEVIESRKELYLNLFPKFIAGFTK